MVQNSQIRVTIYVEGGGKSQKALTVRRCRDGFREYFRKLGLEGRLPKVLPCGSRNDTIEAFMNAVSSPPCGELPVLLVDSEQEVKSADFDRPQLYIFGKGKRLPKGVTGKHLHLLVQCLETVLVADLDAVEEILGGHGFQRGKLPKHKELEQVSHKELVRKLTDASRNVRNKKYDKGRHSFDILRLVDPEKAAAASPWVKRLHEVLLEIC